MTCKAYWWTTARSWRLFSTGPDSMTVLLWWEDEQQLIDIEDGRVGRTLLSAAF
jgi:hypothetical protein